MKKLFLSVATALLSTASYAQTSATTVSIVPKVGINFANISNSGSDGHRTGLALGAELECKLSKLVGISAGALYSQQGSKCEVATTVGTADDGTLRLDYINIPILANVYVTKRLTAKVGVQPAFKVNSSVKATVGNASATEDVDGFNAVDFAIPVGLSYEYRNVVVDARYNIGITKIVDGYGTRKAKNNVLQLTLGYRFEL